MITVGPILQPCRQSFAYPRTCIMTPSTSHTDLPTRNHDTLHVILQPCMESLTFLPTRTMITVSPILQPCRQSLAYLPVYPNRYTRYFILPTVNDFTSVILNIPAYRYHDTFRSILQPCMQLLAYLPTYLPTYPHHTCMSLHSTTLHTADKSKALTAILRVCGIQRISVLYNSIYTYSKIYVPALFMVLNGFDAQPSSAERFFLACKCVREA